MITKDSPGNGKRTFVIMKRLVRHHSRKSHPHPPPQAHSPGISGAFQASYIVVWTYPPKYGG